MAHTGRLGGLWILTPIVLLLWGCSTPSTQEEEAAIRPAVYVVNYPLQYFAERIGGEMVDVRFPAPADEDPAFWRPDDNTVVAYQEADLILLNGAGYADWVDKVSLPAARVVNTSSGFADRYIEVADLVTHSHGPGGEHAHGGTAFTTWLDPALAKLQARAIAEALKKILPGQTALVDANCSALETDLEALGAAFQEITAAAPERPLLASHPVYQYVARAYDWNLKSMHWEPDEMPKDEEWHKLEHAREDHPAKWMLWEGEPLESIVAELEMRGVRSVVFDPCGNVPDSGDYLVVMQENVERLREVFASE